MLHVMILFQNEDQFQTQFQQTIYNVGNDECQNQYSVLNDILWSFIEIYF
jgi:hypothetical protein